MLIHEVDVTLEGGHGGPGKVSFFKKGRGPDGGDGGHGANLIVRVTSDLAALNQFSHQKHIKAPDGEPGESNRKSGRKGEDLEILIPMGSLLADLTTGETRELLVPNETFVVSQGGLGGLGNASLRSARNTTPMHAQKGLPGKLHEFHIELKFLADIGLIGLPNAGKSSLLNALTNANVKVGNYPFTTLEANLGVLQNKIIADLPGLIEGASEGRGLGTKFLKYVEKVKLLVHCIGIESDDLLRDYKIVRTELEKFNPDFAKKPEIILITKTDLQNPDELKTKTKSLAKTKRKVYAVSVNQPEDMAKVKEVLLHS